MDVLIADDDEDSLGLLGPWLTAQGHFVSIARGGKAALRAVQRDPTIKVVIANWLMADLDGWRVSLALKASRGADIKTILLVGESFIGEVRKAFVGCADCYVGKPINLERLEAALADLAATTGRANNRHAMPDR